ncbi:LysM peptidoglycan-binding domain-containing protein [Flavobacterium sp. SUN052]|uniref:peptidoglycan endopeptidase n=1 Tax=Flavobacterium sp. SUN052 TaxID=3002441 RepID=UPI00237EB530|nr:peptidoglycan endopeptidase [Flavobacterium sp. SUN052]MEC4003905.1 LysM peptidoglycan-binding domain-containing protein [Flavobacterium sp. SUN052]
MKFFKIILIIALFFNLNVFSQKIIKHKIKNGESIYGLALKYDLTEKEMYAANPKTKGALLQLGQVVNIPNKKYKEKEKKEKVKPKEKVEKEKIDKKEVAKEVSKEVIKEVVPTKNEPFISHLVAKKETIYSISKKYGITMETLCELNPELKTGNLRTGSKLKIAATENTISDKKEYDNEVKNDASIENKSEVVASNVDVVHKVAPKETLFGISKQFGVSISELLKLNPSIATGLKVGDMLIISKATLQLDGSNDSKSVPTETTDEVIDVKNIPAGNLAKADFLISKASQHLGTRYRSGGTTSAGFDCSGLMFNTFQNISMTLPRSSQEMANYGVKIDKAHAQKGDLIFFATFGGHRVSHVGMITEVSNDGEIKFIHSASSSGVIISSVSEPYYTKSFVQINRVISE